MAGKLTEDIVLALSEALKNGEPKAFVVVQSVVHRSPFTEPMSGRDRSIAGYFTPVLTREEHDTVIAALERVSSANGATARFGGRQLNFVLMMWRGLPVQGSLPEGAR